MCGLFGQKQDIVTTYRAMLSDQKRKKLTIGVGDIAVIQGQSEAFEAVFGLCPSKFDKKMWMFNSRAESGANPKDDRNFDGPYDIVKNPYAGISFSRRRCLIPMSHYFEGPHDKRLSEPYLVERQDGGIIWAGGVWDTWTDRDTRQSMETFSIITTPATDLMAKIRHKRSPLIIPEARFDEWFDLKNKKVFDLVKGNTSDGLHCFLVSEGIKKNLDHPEDILPLGKTIE